MAARPGDRRGARGRAARPHRAGAAGCRSPCRSPRADCPVLTRSRTTAASTTPRGCSSGTAVTTRRGPPRCSRSAMALATPAGTTSRSAAPRAPWHPAPARSCGSASATSGSRPGREVVQAYVTGAPGNAGPGAGTGRLRRVTAGPGEAAEVAVRVPARIFAVFDEDSRAVGMAARPSSPCRSAAPHGTCGCRSPCGRGDARRRGGPCAPLRRRDELDLVTVPVLQVGRVVVKAARVRVAVAEQQPPPVLRCFLGELSPPLPWRRHGRPDGSFRGGTGRDDRPPGRATAPGRYRSTPARQLCPSGHWMNGW